MPIRETLNPERASARVSTRRKQCKACGASMPQREERCTHCGATLEDDRQRLLWAIYSVAAFLLFCLALYFVSHYLAR